MPRGSTILSDLAGVWPTGLLNRMKNSAASTLEFEEKKKKYFGGQTGVTTFALTVEVLNEPTWTPRVLEQRQSRLLSALMEAWQLS